MIEAVDIFASPRIVAGDVVLLGTVVATAWGAKGPVSKWWVARRTRKEILESLPAAIAKIAEDIKIVRSEVVYNGGHSLKDVVRENGYRISLEIASRRLTSEHATWEGRVRHPNTSEAEPEFVSHAWTKITGMSAAETADGGWIQAIASEDRPRVIVEARIAAEEQKLFHTEYTAVNVLTGVRTKVSHIGRPLFDYTGTLYGWVGLMVPINEHTLN